jgi:hypothetical protein
MSGTPARTAIGKNRRPFPSYVYHPAKAGIHAAVKLATAGVMHIVPMDSRLRGNDE